jgi:quercetin dioxygenase-like cupin family protein
MSTQSTVDSSGDPMTTGGNVRTPYETWMRRQGVPILEGYGVTDLAEHPLSFWDRIGCDAFFVHLKGMEGITGMYIAEIKPGETTKEKRHLYEEVVYVLEGRGSTTLKAANGKVHQFEWDKGSLFAIPLNTPHIHFSTSNQPVRYVAFTTAPLVFDLFYNEEFVFNTAFPFSERFSGEPSYFDLDIRHPATERGMAVWETNFIPDVSQVMIDAAEHKGRGVQLTQFEIAGNSLIGHFARWPVGQYHKAHHHGGGAILLIVESVGYTLMWPNELGLRPYENGRGDEVVRVDWQPGSVFSPPTGWYHQHFNTGNVPALQLAMRNGSSKFPFGVRRSQTRKGVLTSTREGGTMIEYEDEDPAIRPDYEEALRLNGVTLEKGEWVGTEAG